MVSLLEDMARCLGHGVGPSGHQNRVDCVNCVRRTAPRHYGVVYMDPPSEYPCPKRIGRDLGSSNLTPESLSEAPKPCPFCGGVPKTIERPDNIDGTEFFYAVACYCGGYSACAHKMAKRKTPEQAKASAIAAWNQRSMKDSPAHSSDEPK